MQTPKRNASHAILHATRAQEPPITSAHLAMQVTIFEILPAIPTCANASMAKRQPEWGVHCTAHTCALLPAMLATTSMMIHATSTFVYVPTVQWPMEAALDTEPSRARPVLGGLL